MIGIILILIVFLFIWFFRRIKRRVNPKRLQKAIDLKAINGVLIKLNQIGTLTETVDCCMLARKHGLMTVVSHRGGGETNDTTMIDLAVAVNSGSPSSENACIATLPFW